MHCSFEDQATDRAKVEVRRAIKGETKMLPQRRVRPKEAGLICVVDEARDAIRNKPVHTILFGGRHGHEGDDARSVDDNSLVSEASVVRC